MRRSEFVWNGITQQNRNGLLWRDPTVDGVKTGHTETAGYCLIASAKRDGMRLVSVVLGTDSMRAREDASAALLNYGFNFFEIEARLRRRPAAHDGAGLERQAEPEVGLVLKRDLFVTSQRGHLSSVKADFELPEPLVAPLPADKPVGKTSIVVDGAAGRRATTSIPATDVAQAASSAAPGTALRLLFH